MDLSLEPSIVIEIVSVFIGFGICIICCFSCLKLCRASRVEVVQPVERPSVFIVPMPSEDNVFRPPRYSTTDFTEFPPPYSEVEMKPDMFPVSESTPPPYIDAIRLPPPPLPLQHPAQELSICRPAYNNHTPVESDNPNQSLSPL